MEKKKSHFLSPPLRRIRSKIYLRHLKGPNEKNLCLKTSEESEYKKSILSKLSDFLGFVYQKTLHFRWKAGADGQ